MALQIIDLAGMALIIRMQGQAAGRYQLYSRTLDARWDPLVSRSRSIAFILGDVTSDLNLFQEIAWRAVKDGRVVTTVYAARTSQITARRLGAEGAAFARGELVPGRLYILLAGSPLPLPLFRMC